MLFIEWQKSCTGIDNKHVMKKKSSYYTRQISLSPSFGLISHSKFIEYHSYGLTGSNEGSMRKGRFHSFHSSIITFYGFSVSSAAGG